MAANALSKDQEREPKPIQALRRRWGKQSRVGGELPMEVPWDTVAAGEQVKRSSRRRRSQGNASNSRSRRRDENKLLLSRIDKENPAENPAEEQKNSPPPAREKEEEEEERLLDEEEAAQDRMRSFRRGWDDRKNQASFDQLIVTLAGFISAVDRPISCSCISWSDLHHLLIQLATVVKVQVTDGSWPDHLRGKVIARTISIDRGDIMLLDPRDGRMPITRDGEIKLSRNVVSVEFLSGHLKVRVVASQIDNSSDVIIEDTVVLAPLKASFSYGTCDLGFCKVEVTVAWSLIATLADMRFLSI
ncbi:hypothetical protein BAE44_0006135 [Dichanthelium oligosanthes]|uniref:DUF6598 domain-containing protein n=1 Tax=Dichanthelium oligosanthes TaxID=888268 RepID=A0A1E5W623_9POAL|nr:hypothetical protein BAE44_0006135 [Dichanthelium oligosanthes]